MITTKLVKAPKTPESQIKKPRFWYYDKEAEKSYPLSDEMAEALIIIGIIPDNLDNFSEEHVSFMRFDMSDEEMENLPDE